MNVHATFALILAGLLCIHPAAHAESQPRRIAQALWDQPSFRSAHPDLEHRLLAQQALDDGDLHTAVREFEKAASFGDKMSQAMLAEIHQTGRGVPPDPARAYAWMDLAAERGFVPFIGKRERLWAALDPGQRAEALRVGADLYARHGDEVALPRLEARLKRELKRMGGSRTGVAGAGSVILPTAGGTRVRLARRGQVAALGGPQVDLAQFYAPEFWRVGRYVDWQDAQLELARRGQVEVGAPRPGDASTAAD